MVATNYHAHCYLDDGEGKLEEYVEQALSEGLAALGFSCHAPLPFPCDWVLSEEGFSTYSGEVAALKRRYASRLQIYFGLEIDYLRGLYGPADPKVDSWRLDYTIGSVHFVDDPSSGEHLEIDGSSEKYAHCLASAFGGDIRKMVREYYQLVREMAAGSAPDIIGHFDVIKKNNPGGRYFSESEQWYRDEVLRSLETVAASGSILEVNTGGLARGRTDSVYPSPWILAESAKRGIPTNINSDAHNPRQLTYYFAEARSLLRESGYSERKVLLDGTWQTVEL